MLISFPVHGMIHEFHMTLVIGPTYSVFHARKVAISIN